MNIKKIFPDSEVVAHSQVKYGDNMQEFIDAGLDTHDWAMFEPQLGDLPEAVAIAIETGIDAYRASHPVPVEVTK